MAKYLSNAFSLQMLTSADADINVIEVDKDQIPFNKLISTIGHQDIADLLGVPVNRVNTKLGKDDVLYVAQYIGKRLPEGATSLPEGAAIKFFRVTVRYNMKKIGLTKPNVSRQFFRKESNGSWTQSNGIWEDMAEPNTWRFVEQLLPDYDQDQDVALSNDLSCVIEKEDDWDMDKFARYHPQYKGYTTEQLKNELEKVDAQLYKEAEDYLQEAIEGGQIEVREFPVIIVSAIMPVDANCKLVSLICADKTDSSCAKEFTVPASQLQNVKSRIVIEDGNCERFQIYYKSTNGSGNEYWCDANSEDFV